MQNNVNTVAEKVGKDGEHAADLDQALAVAGLGWYNIKYSFILALFLIGAIVEPLGYSFVVPAAMCDLEMTESQRGFIASIPYIGIVVTSFPWGYLVDTRGRKNVVVIASFLAGVFGVVAAFMPNLIAFAIVKSISALCIACPAAVPYTFIGEIIPAKNRDLVLSVTNALQVSGTLVVPLLAWAILPLDFRINFGLYLFRPWRLLAILYASVFIIAAALMMCGPESPKLLVSQGKMDEALVVLQNIYIGNKKKGAGEFPIKRLIAPPYDSEKKTFFKSLRVQSVPLFKPPYVKWFALNSFLMFGVFSTLNGLYMWVPDVLNRVMAGDGDDKTACDIIFDRLNQTSESDECVDTIETVTFVINAVANASCTVICLAVGSCVKFIGKKRLLIIVLLLTGTFCVLINFITQDMVFAVLLSSIQILSLAIGPINAYSGEFFPTHLRGMAVGLTMMCGRAGSIVGINVAGVLLNAVCELTFYVFGGLLIVCGLLSFLLPGSQRPLVKKELQLENSPSDNRNAEISHL
uniref:SFRICE_023245 n=1 Tax=Spodoptera frugiperda TaxID=7108 RepID=A0A2H1WYT6_SPOFR